MPYVKEKNRIRQSVTLLFFTSFVAVILGSVQSNVFAVLTQDCETDMCLDGVEIWGSFESVGPDPSVSYGSGDRIWDLQIVNDPVEVAADFRDEPACLREQLVLAELMAVLNLPGVQSGQQPPPGQVAMDPTRLGDPTYQGGEWTKMEFNVIDRFTQVTPSGPRLLERSRVSIHYMFNTITRQFGQVKFKNTVEQGCPRG